MALHNNQLRYTSAVRTGLVRQRSSNNYIERHKLSQRGGADWRIHSHYKGERILLLVTVPYR